jgi:hypothetical protein
MRLLLSGFLDLAKLAFGTLCVFAWCFTVAFLEIFFGAIVRMAVWWYDLRHPK